LQDLQNHQGYDEFDHQWIVIDRDEERTNSGGHTLENFTQAITIAKSKGIKVAYSNPCFEIWYLLHFEYRNTAIDRDELVEKLELNYQYAKNKLFAVVLNQDLQITAIKNAQKLHNASQSATDNPNTTVHELVKLLNGFKTENS
jgi:hypothetical protein